MKIHHTPGPWTIAQGSVHLWIKDDAGETVLALHRENNKDAEANARLIAASPDLLECVRGFVESWGKEVDNDEPMQGSDVVEWVSGAMLEFRLALAKATGGKA